MSKEWTAKWIGLQDGDTFNPVFFKDFQVDHPIRKATFYITACGVFEAYINGSRISTEYLTPYRTGENGTVQYFAYDVTDLLYAGPDSASNSIDVFLGKGWNEENAPIALRAEIVLEPSDEDAEYALDMWWEELQSNAEEDDELADPYEKEDIFGLHANEELRTDDDPEDDYYEEDDFADDYLEEEDYSEDDYYEEGDYSEDDYYEEDDYPEDDYFEEDDYYEDDYAEDDFAEEEYLSDDYLPDDFFEDDPLPEEADTILDELLSEPEEEYPEVTEEILNGATGFITSSGDYLEPKHDQKRLHSLTDDPSLEEAEKLLEDEEPEMEFLSSDDPVWVASKRLEALRQAEAKKKAYADFDFPHDFKGVFGDVVAEPDPYKSIPGMKKWESFGEVPEEDPEPDSITDEAIQAILAEQEKQLASFVPSFFDEEKQLKETLAEAVADSSFTDEVPADVDDLADEIAAEISGDTADLTPEERAWYRDVEGQVAFDFADDAEGIAEDAFSEEEMDELFDEALDGEKLKELFDEDTDLFGDTGLIGRKWSPLKAKPTKAKPVKPMSFLEVAPFDEEEAPEEDQIFFGGAPAEEDFVEEVTGEEESEAEALEEEETAEEESEIDDLEEEAFNEEEPEEEFEEVELEETESEEEDLVEEDFEETVLEVAELTEEDLDADEPEIEELTEEALEAEGFFAEEDFEEEDLFDETDLPDDLGLFEEVPEEEDLFDETDLPDMDLTDEIEVPAEELAELEGSLEEELEEPEEVFDEAELEALLAEEIAVEAEEVAPAEEASAEETPAEEVLTEEVSAEEVPTEDVTEEIEETIEEAAEEILEEIPVEETTGDAAGEITEETPEETPEAEAAEAEPTEDNAETEAAEQVPAEEIAADEAAELTEGEPPEAAQKAIAPETTDIETEAPKKGFKKRFRAFDLAKMIGLTMGDEAEEKTAAAEEITEEIKEETKEEQFVVIGTDETWGYYASDIETSRIDGYEIFDRMHWIGKENPDKDAVVLDLDIPLVETYTQPMKVQAELPAQSITPVGNGEGYVLDFGQIFTGFVTFQSTLAEGARVTLSYSEDGESFAEDSNAFVYVSDGIPEAASPHFTLFTGRYVRLTGWEEQPDLAAFTGFVIGQDEAAEAEPAPEEAQSETATGIPLAAALETETEETEAEEPIEEIADAEEETAKTAFDTSDQYLNQIVAEQIGTMQNYLATVQKLADGTLPVDETVERIPTDEFCAGIRTACLTADAKDVLLQYFKELRTAQVANEKAIPAYLPDDGNASKCCMHAGEAIKGIWTLYEMYGDPAILEENEDLIKDAICYISKEETEERYLVPCKGIQGEETEGSFITTVYYYEAVMTAMKVADVLGREEEKARYEALAGKIKEAFLDEYFTRSGRLAEDTQTAYVLALRAGLYDEKEKLEEEFRKRLKKDCYQITCGPVGLRDLCMVLAECGDTELAYRFLMDSLIPYDLKQEKAAEFLFTYVNGVCPLTPGFEKIRLRPLPDSRLVYSSCEQQSPKGMIQSNWEVTADEMIQLHFEIPEGCEAQVFLPDCAEESLKEQSLTSGTYDFTYQPTKDYLHLFHENSLAGDILKYDESLAIVEETDPALAEELLNGDAELLAKSLGELISDPELLAQIKEKLFQLQ